MKDIPSPRRHLIDMGKRYPGAWKQVDRFRAERGTLLPDWPDWCYIPIGATLAIVADNAGIDGSMMGALRPDLGTEPARLAALATWRVTQGIYRFDPELFASVIDTPINSDLPTEVLYRLPEWCVYVETPGLEWMFEPLAGFFAHLEYDINSGAHELRLLMDIQSGLMPMPLRLGAGSLKECLIGRYQGNEKIRDEITRQLGKVVSLLLYLGSQPDEIGTEGSRPANPRPKRTKKGWRLFAPNQPTGWDVGVRMGAALRRARDQAENEHSPETGTGRRPRAHIRRAHWHGYWKGSKDPERASERRFDLKWQPPIPVNITPGEELPSVIHPVKNDEQ